MKSLDSIRFKLFILLFVLSCFNDYVSARLVKQFTYKDFPRYQTLKELSEGKEIKAESIKYLEKVLDTVFYENKGRTPQPIKINKELELKDITAHSLGAEYVFAPEFIELSPELVNKSKNYKGLHGNAIVSRFPIKNPRILKLPLTYDWYEEELKKKSPAESVRRTSSKVTIKEETLTELRQGARVALIADILLPMKELERVSLRRISLNALLGLLSIK